MSGTLNHMPADIIRRLLINAGYGTNGGTWPIYSGNEPDTPDNCITIYNSEGRRQGRIQFDGEVQEQYGIQVRVRCAPHQITDGYLKCHNICRYFDSTVLRTLVAIGSDTYKIQSINRQTAVINLGSETPTSRRRIYVADALTVITQLPGTGSY